MPRGGRRPGAGKKKGSKNLSLPEKRDRLKYTDTKYRENVRKSLEITPLEVMSKTMQLHVEAADILSTGIVRVDEKIITQLGILKEACGIAKDLAPYLHKKQPVAVENSGPNGGPQQHHITVEIVDGKSPHEE